MMPVQRSVSIHMAREGREGLAMGTTGSVANIGMLVGHYLIPVIFFMCALLSPVRDR